jgi:hypothetical protein
MRLLCLLVCCLAACGDDGVRHTPDAAPHDGPLADTGPDGPLQPVTLTATYNGAPQAGVQVYFLDADNSLVLATTTDASGTASAVMAAGGSVTAIDPYAQVVQTAIAGGGHDLYTFAGVKPGDNLRLDDRGEQPSTIVTVNAPIDSAAGVASYEVLTPCGGGGTLTDPGSGASPTGQLGIGPECGTSTDFLIITRDEGSQILDYAYVQNQAFSDGGTVDLTAATYAAASTRNYSFTDVPATWGSPSFSDSIVTPQGELLQQFSFAPDDGTPTPVVTPAIGTHLSVSEVFGASVGDHELVDWGPYTDAYTADVGARVLHDLSGFPTVDRETHTISFDELAGGADPDLVVTGVYTYREADDTSWYWQIAAPHATTIAMPVLPTDLYDFTIGPTDSGSADQLLLAKVPGGYDAVRPYIFAARGPSSLVTGASGSATLELVFAKGVRRQGTSERTVVNHFQRRRR